MELAEYGRAIARGWWIVLVCLLAGIGAAAIITARATPVYESSVKFYVVSPPGAGQSPLQSLELSRGRIASYASIIKSDKFVESLVKNSSTGLSASQMAESVSASADQNTLILTVVVSLSDPAKANETAQAIVAGLNSALAEVEGGRAPTVVANPNAPPGEVAGGRAQAGVGQTVLNVVAGPTFESEPVSPRTSLNLGLGALLGLGAGIATAVSRRLMDHRLRTPGEVDEASGLPLLARIPVGREARKASWILQTRPASLFDEAARRLRTNMDHLTAMPPSGVVVISSALEGEGKSTVALMLARAWAEAGERVLLVEADLRNPRLAENLGLANRLGLADVLAGRATLGSVIQQTASDGLHVVAAGTVPANPTELLASRTMTAVLGEMRGTYGRVIVDAPAMQPFSDAALLAVQADWTVIVVRHRRVSRELLRATLRNLELVKGRADGAVLNALPIRLSEGRRQLFARLFARRRTPGIPGAETPSTVPADPPAATRAAARR